MSNPTSLQDLLVWLAGVGGPMFVGYAMSLLAENWPKWGTLPRWVKFIVPLIASALLAVGANLALQYTAEIAAIQPWYQIVAAAVLVWLSSQKALMDTKKSQYGITPDKRDRYGA